MMLPSPKIAGVLLVSVVLTLSGCASVGPRSIPRDRIEYSSVMGDSWKEQTLLNIVRLRYLDAPVFLDVSSVISSYTLESQVDLRGNFLRSPATDNQSIGGYGRYTDRPTISYTPLTGDKFSRSLLRPIPPAAVFSMIQAGYPADFILSATVRAMNGRYNRSTGANLRPAEPEFEQLVAAMRRIQQSEGLGMRIERRGGEDVTLLFFRSAAADQALEADIALVVRLLGLRPPLEELHLTYGAVPRNDKEIAMQTRSMIEIMIEFADGIDVPAEHISSGRTYAGLLQRAGSGTSNLPLASISSGDARPQNAYAAVKYRDAWYWIDDTDIRSKRSFTFMMMFFSLAETGTTAQAPVITVGAN